MDRHDVYIFHCFGGHVLSVFFNFVYCYKKIYADILQGRMSVNQITAVVATFAFHCPLTTALKVLYLDVCVQIFILCYLIIRLVFLWVSQNTFFENYDVEKILYDHVNTKNKITFHCYKS